MNINLNERPEGLTPSIRLKKREQIEKYQFLEDVPNYQEKLKKFKLFKELTKEFQKRLNEDNLVFYWPDQADREVREINYIFGPNSAKYRKSVDIRGRNIFRIEIILPKFSEFEDILDEKRENILPSKEKEIN